MYKCDNKFYFRFPYLPLDTLDNVSDDNFKNDCLRIYREDAGKIVSSLSYDLTETLEGGCENKDVINALYKYINRSSYRTTPFGLAAGVGFGFFGEKDNCSLEQVYSFLRIGMDWLNRVILECEKIIGQHLIIVKNNTIEQEGNIYIQGWNDCFIDQKSINKKIQINKTAYIQFVLDLCNKPVSIQTILKQSSLKYPEVDQIVFESVVNLLVKKEFLISNLRVNSSCINPFKHLLERISQDYANIKSELFSQLFLLDQKITEYNSEQLNDKSCLKLDEIKQLMKQIQDIKNGLQIDLCCRNQIFITNGIKINVEEFADFIENCTYQSNAAKFIDAFIEKYGYQRVKFLDVIKDNRLNNLMTDRSDSIKFNDKLQLIILSIFEEERSDSVDLYKYKDRFIFDHDNNLKLSDSMELAFYVTKENNKYELITTPLGGSHKRNNIIGRFKYLYDMHEDQGNTYAISYTPNNSHVYGVIQSILPCEKHIYCGGYDETGLDYNDIYIGIKNMEICFYSKSQLKEIKIINNNMATLDTMPHPLKRLLELASDGIASPISFLECIYHMVYNYPGIHFPEIKYKQIIVVPESWRLEKKNITKEEFNDYFKAFCEKYKLPETVVAGERDNKLYLSTKKKSDVAILWELYNRDNNIVLFDSKIKSDNLIIKDLNDRTHVGEFIFELQKDKKNEISHFGEFPITDESFFEEKDIIKNKRGLFDGWIYIKLYICRELQTKCILYFFEKIYPKLIKERNSDLFFFIRYKDPNDHLRIRIKASQYNFIMPILELYIKKLQESEMLSSYEFVQYEPEIYRYGGKRCIGRAEEFFHQDSIAALSLLEMCSARKTQFSLKQIYIISAANIMNTLGLTAEVQNNYLSQYHFKTKANIEFANEFEPLKDIIQSKNYTLENEDLITMQIIFDERSSALVKYWKTVVENNKNEKIRLNIVLSILHMHFNRLFGINRGLEQRLMGYLRKLVNEWYSYEKFKEKYANKNTNFKTIH